MNGKKNLIDSLFDGDNNSHKVNAITEKIIGSSYKVMNELGNGFLEKVYENALAYELRTSALKTEQQKKLKVFYKNFEVGKYEPDLVVENTVIVGLKTVNSLENSHRAQCLNYLKATGLKICLLINFGKPKVEVKRVAL
jgi:GxxExxY protein